MKTCPTCHHIYPTSYSHCPQDTARLVHVGEWAEGMVVRGKYRILRKLGHGGMASVYSAVHLRFDEVRALKLMSLELAGDPAFVKRFEHEAIFARRLTHPNAVRVDDIDEADDGRPFIVMEYVEGETLKSVVRRDAPLAVERACAITTQIAAALDAAHQLGIVHRDIKPDNVMLVGGRAETAKVLDFGIAKIRDVGSGGGSGFKTLTGTGFIVGTPAYMSPEQAQGMGSDQIDGRSDLYSLGVAFYEMLAGRLPLEGRSTEEFLEAHITRQPRPIREWRPEIPEPLARVVMGCLEKRPADRPSSARQLIDGIQASTSAATLVTSGSRPTPRPPVVVGDGPSTPATSRSRLAWLLALAAAVVVALVVFVLRPGGSPASLPPVTPSPPPASSTVDSSAPSGGVPAISREAVPAQPIQNTSPPAASPPGGDSRPRAESPAERRTRPESVDGPPRPQPPPAVAQSPAAAGDRDDPVVARALAIGSIHETRGAYDRAIEVYGDALKQRPDDPTLRERLDRAVKAQEQTLAK